MPKLPKRFIHPLPEAAPPLLVDPPAPTREDVITPPSPLPLPPAARLRMILNSPRNVFGLVRRYFAGKFPTADPEELVTLADLSEPVDPPPPLLNDSSNSNGPNFSPYPNKTSFDLGNYYWNGSQQKTQADFKQLMDILTDPGFTPSDLRDTNWSQINAAIGENIEVLPNVEGQAEWLNADAGWIRDHIDISVPFAKGSDEPGASVYPGVDLYHRKIVDVLKERISNPHASQNFHMTPYELQWQPTPEHREVRVQGEMYTSPAFFEAQEALQNSPPEPGCDLERVVVSLMWWSDVTHLTNFGTAHLWPLYLFLGNDSKYRRCKPSCHLCSHVAYFQTVSTLVSAYSSSLTYILSCPMNSKILQTSISEVKGLNPLSWPTAAANSSMLN